MEAGKALQQPSRGVCMEHLFPFFAASPLFSRAEPFNSSHSQFKIDPCPRGRPHDWTQCVFAHPLEKARRRDPRRVAYSGSACPTYRKAGACGAGGACPLAHGVFECWLHPARYRTQVWEEII